MTDTRQQGCADPARPRAQGRPSPGGFAGATPMQAAIWYVHLLQATGKADAQIARTLNRSLATIRRYGKRPSPDLLPRIEGRATDPAGGPADRRTRRARHPWPTNPEHAP